jgi:hypothetical protein
MPVYSDNEYLQILIASTLAYFTGSFYEASLMNPELSMGIIACKVKLNGLVSDQLQTLSSAT